MPEAVHEYTPTTPLGFINDDLDQLYGELTAQWQTYLGAGVLNTAVETNQGSGLVWRCNSTATQLVYFVMPVPPSLRGKDVGLYGLVTVDGTSAGDLVLSLRTEPIILGGVAGSFTSANTVRTAPTVSGEWTSLLFDTRTLGADDVAILVRMGRVGGSASDTNTDNLDLAAAAMVVV